MAPGRGLVVVMLALTVPLAAGDTPVTREVFLMGTRAVVTTWAPDRAQGLDRLEMLLQPLEAAERQLSTWREDSEVSRLNAAAVPVALSVSLCELLDDAGRWNLATGGTFDPAVGALTRVWGIHERGRLPSDEEIAGARLRSGWHRLALDRASCIATLEPGVTLDVGAFGKGVALDRARAAFPAAVPWLIDLGGQVAVNGTPPDGKPWRVSIADPRNRAMAVLDLQLPSGSLATSGGSERDAQVAGRRVGHILDPRTGRPAAFDGSVTVWHERGLAADVLSTALYVMGPEDGLRWADGHEVAACFLLRDGRVRASRAFEREFPVPARFLAAAPR